MPISLTKTTVENTQLYAVKPRRAFLANSGLLPVINPDQAMSNAFTEAPLDTKAEIKRENSLRWSQSYTPTVKTNVKVPNYAPKRAITFKRDIDETLDDYILNQFEKASLESLRQIVKNAESIQFMSKRAKSYFSTQINIMQSGVVDPNVIYTTPVKPLDIQILKSQIERYDATLLTDTTSIINILRTPELVRFLLVRSRMTNLTPEKKTWFDLFKKVAEQVAIKNRLFRFDWTQTPEQFDATVVEGFPTTPAPTTPAPTTSAPTTSAPNPEATPTFFHRADAPDYNPHPDQDQPPQPSGQITTIESATPPPSLPLAKEATEVYNTNQPLYDPETGKVSELSFKNMEDIIKSSQDENDAIRRLYDYLSNPYVLPREILIKLVEDVNATRPSVGSGRRLLAEDIKYIWKSIQKILVANNVITPEQLSRLVLSMDAKKSAPTQAPTTQSPTTQPPSTSSQPPSLKKRMLDIITSASDRNDAIRQIFTLLHLSEHSVPLATHEDLLNAYRNQEPKITNLENKMKDSSLFTTEDLRKIWLSIRMVILETKVLDPSELLELMTAMDSKTFPQPGDENFFDSVSTFGSDSYNLVIGLLVSLIHFPRQLSGDLMTFLIELAYLPNGFTYSFITQIARTFLNNVVNTINFVDIIGSFLQASKTSQGMFSWAGTVLSNQISLFLVGALGSTGNTLLRIFFKFGLNNPTKFKLAFSTWFMLLQWLFFGLAPGKTRLTKTEITARVGRIGTIDVQKWSNLLINSFLYINSRPGAGDANALLNQIINEIGENSVYQIVDWMSRPFDTTVTTIDANPFLRNIPEAQRNQENQIRYVDQPQPQGVQQQPQPEIVDTSAGMPRPSRQSSGTQLSRPLGRQVVENPEIRRVSAQEERASFENPELQQNEDILEQVREQFERTSFDNPEIIKGEPLQSQYGKELSEYNSISESVSQAGGYLPGVFQNVKDLVFINSWGIFLDYESAKTILNQKQFLFDSVYDIILHEKEFRDPTLGNFVELSPPGSTPRLVSLLRAVWRMCSESLDFQGFGMQSTTVSRLLNQTPPSNFNEDLVKQYVVAFSGFLYNCILMLNDKGIQTIPNVDITAPVIFVKNVGFTIASILYIFMDKYQSYVDDYADSRKKVNPDLVLEFLRNL